MKRLSEEFGPGEAGDILLRAGRERFDGDRAAALRTRVLLAGIAASAAAPAQASAGQGQVATVLAKTGAAKLALLLVVSGALAVIAWRYWPQGSPSEKVVPVAAHAVHSEEVLEDAQPVPMLAPPLENRVASSAPPTGVTTPSPISKPARKRRRVSRLEIAANEPARVAPAEAQLDAPRQLEVAGPGPTPPEAPVLESAATLNEPRSSLADEAAFVFRIRDSLARDKNELAAAEIRRYRERFADGVLAQDVGFLRLRVLANTKHPSFSAERERYLSRYPASPYRTKIHQLKP